jgi:hypothetical protein
MPSFLVDVRLAPAGKLHPHCPAYLQDAQTVNPWGISGAPSYSASWVWKRSLLLASDDLRSCVSKAFLDPEKER